MKNNSLPTSKREILFFDNDKNNIAMAKTALKTAGLDFILNDYTSTVELKSNWMQKLEKPPKCIFVCFKATSNLPEFFKTIEKSIQLRHTPIVFISNNKEKVQKALEQIPGNTPNNVLGILKGPFNEKLFMQMVYSIRIYWDNMNYAA